MVRFTRVRRFAREETGIVLIEALLVLPIVLLTITAMVELGYAVFHWNQTVKAVQIGARHASVSSPMMTRATYEAAMTADYGTIGEGDPTPSTPRSISCGGGATACDPTLMDRLITGGDGVCAPGGNPAGMCDAAPWIGPDNVLVTYSRTGLGYVGRPFGAVTTVTVEIKDVQFGLLILNEILALPSNFTLPPHRVSTTSEDLSSCKVSC